MKNPHSVRTELLWPWAFLGLLLGVGLGFGLTTLYCPKPEPEPKFEPCTCPTYPTAASAERALKGMGLDLMKHRHKWQDLELKLETCRKTLEGRPVCAEDDEYLGWNTGIYDLEGAYESLHVISVEFCNREIRAATEFCNGYSETAEEMWLNTKAAVEALDECKKKIEAM